MSPRDRRALVVGSAVVGVAILVLRIGPLGWRTVVEQRTELQAKAELLERMRVDARSTTRLEDSGAVVKGRLSALASELLTGGTVSEATADLAARLAAVADHHRVRLSQTDPVVDSMRRGAVGRAALRAALESDTRGLFRFLEAVGQEPTILVIDSLRITVVDPHVSGDRAELLRTDLTVRGWFLSGRASR